VKNASDWHWQPCGKRLIAGTGLLTMRSMKGRFYAALRIITFTANTV
jgi:hypothetical protein